MAAGQSMLAKTDAAGSQGLLAEVLAFSSSLQLDRALYREDLIGSLAHAQMLGSTGLIPPDASRALRVGLSGLYRDAAQGRVSWPAEEDIHMAVEAELGRRVGEAARMLHTARSRNDQVATDLRLHVREACLQTMQKLVAWGEALVTRAEAERHVVLPAYTHRQRAMPVSASFWLLSWAAAALRDLDALDLAFRSADVLPLGAGAIAGTSLPIDREQVREALRFSSVTVNAMDTVGDRDFALDFLYAASRTLLHLGRLSTDVIDFSSSEFGFLSLGGEIACGSSMMPQKRNPDVFELVRGQSARGVGNLVSLLVLVKGLPGGYNRDLQEDRTLLLQTGPLLSGALDIVTLALGHLRFDVARCLAAVSDGSTQATDLAEALVRRGMAFRTAYKKVGALVRLAADRRCALVDVSPKDAADIEPLFAEVLAEALSPERSVAAKASVGSTGPASVEQQLRSVRASLGAWRTALATRPALDSLFSALQLEET